MTKNTKRDKAKRPSLDKKLNLKARTDFIEPDYINGVYNDEGELVIRPMTEEEIDWLAQYYEESVAVNFWHDQKLKKFKEHPRYKEINILKREMRKDPEIKKLKQRILDENPETMPDEDERETLLETYELAREQFLDNNIDDEELKELYTNLVDAQNEFLLLKSDLQRKEVSDENNARNRCLYNKKKKIGWLLDLDVYPDIFMSDNAECQDPERLLMMWESDKDLE